MQLQATKCDTCGKPRKSELDGSTWSEFSDNYETEVREYYLCNLHDKEARNKL